MSIVQKAAVPSGIAEQERLTVSKWIQNSVTSLNDHSASNSLEAAAMNCENTCKKLPEYRTRCFITTIYKNL